MPVITLKFTNWANVFIWRLWVRASQIYSNMYPTRCNFTQFIYIWKRLWLSRRSLLAFGTQVRGL